MKHHPHVVRLRGLCTNWQGDNEAIVLEYLQGKSLHEYIQAHQGTIYCLMPVLIHVKKGAALPGTNLAWELESELCWKRMKCGKCRSMCVLAKCGWFSTKFRPVLHQCVTGTLESPARFHFQVAELNSLNQDIVIRPNPQKLWWLYNIT